MLVVLMLPFLFLLFGIALVVAAFGIYNEGRRRAAETAHPPRVGSMRVNGVRLRVLDTRPGEAEAIVLLHGNVVTLEDWTASGVVAALSGHRVLAFDRPGFGYSERPGGRWGAVEQARLLLSAAEELGVRRPVVVGHSWAALVALAAAVEHGEKLGGVLLVSGAFYPERRSDAAFVAPAAAPGVGLLLRHTVSPIYMRSMLRRMAVAMFAPARVPERFWTEVPTGLFSRPGQLRSIAADGAAMHAEQERLLPLRAPLRCPVAVIVGDADRVASPERHSIRFARETGATLDVLAGVGHMAHWADPGLVARRATALLPHG